MLNLSKDWLRSYLPHCLQKIDRVSFGLLSLADLKRALAVDPLMPQVIFFFLFLFQSVNNLFSCSFPLDPRKIGCSFCWKGCAFSVF